MTKLVLSENQKWVVVKALHFLTSPIGEEHLLEQFQDLEWNELEKDIDGIIDQINSPSRSIEEE